MENIWTKVLVETSNDKGETWKKDTRYYCGDITKENKFEDSDVKKHTYVSLVYTDKSTSEFKPDTDIIKEVKL